MTDTQKPRRVTAKITRTVTERAVVLLDRDGNVEEVEDTLEVLDYEVTELHCVISVLSVRS